jgi:hypothetical protein
MELSRAERWLVPYVEQDHKDGRVVLVVVLMEVPYL